MKQEDQVAMHAPMDAVRQAFEQWRNTRSGRERIPEELWQAAVDLSESYTLCKISTELKLDYSRLRRRIQERSPEPPLSRFIEVPMDRFLPSSQCTVHLRSPAGFELTVHACAGYELQLPHLIDRFLSQSR
jgi:hypothetical protein